MTKMKAAAVALCACAAWAAGPAGAQPYPSKPIRMIVSLPAGGGVDIMARLVAQGLSARLGQQIVIENRPGAAGTIATQAVARSPADGYTILASSNIEITITPNLQPVGYDPVKDLAPLVRTVTVPSVLVAAGTAPYRSMKELLALIKAKNGKYSYGTPGTGSAMHIAVEAMREKVGLDLVQVPYKGRTARARRRDGRLDHVRRGGPAAGGEPDPLGQAAGARADEPEALGRAARCPDFRRGDRHGAHRLPDLVRVLSRRRAPRPTSRASSRPRRWPC